MSLIKKQMETNKLNYGFFYLQNKQKNNKQRMDQQKATEIYEQQEQQPKILQDALKEDIFRFYDRM